MHEVQSITIKQGKQKRAGKSIPPVSAFLYVSEYLSF